MLLVPSFPCRKGSTAALLTMSHVWWAGTANVQSIDIKFWKYMTNMLPHFSCTIYQTQKKLNSGVPLMWTCVGCQQFAGCSIDGWNTKLCVHDPRFRWFWPLLGVQNGVRLRPPPIPPWTPCHLLHGDLEMQSSLKASWSIWNASVAFFPSFMQNLIAYRCSSERFVAPCYKVAKKKTLHAEARLSARTARSKLATGCVGRADPSPHCPTGVTVLPWIVASQ